MNLNEFFNPQLRRYKMINEYVKGEIIIDLGSFEGNLHIFLKKNYPEIIGVDKIGGSNVDIVHDLDETPYRFSSNSADTIIAGDIIEHVISPINFLNECYRILKKGGKLIITTANMVGLQYILGVQKNNPSTVHLYGWNEDLFKSLVKRTKFKFKKINLFTAYWNRNLFFRLLCSLIPNIKTNLFVVLEK